MKLWQKDSTQISQFVEKFTVGRDKEFDVLLAKYDVLGSLAHTEMLSSVGLLTIEDKNQIHEELNHILKDIEQNRFTIEEDVEDVHSQIELLLTCKIGDAGKKIHSGRSRNDQVAVDLKLYLKDAILGIKDNTTALFEQLIVLSETHKEKLLPGYTHLQIAMPSSFGLWFGAYAESLVDDMEMLLSAYKMVDKNPLGSGAGYGSSFPLNRTKTTTELGFGDLHYNAVYAQMSRGKAEKFASIGIAAIAATLSRLAMDVCLFMNQNFGFISFPDALTTGSSIMPHKKNPDIFELIRGKCNRLQSLPNELSLLLTNLPSGYHRELQLTKEIIFPGIETIIDCLAMLQFALPQMQIKDGILQDDKYKYLFTVEAVNDLVNQGMSFRDAYKTIGNQVEQGTFTYEGFNINRHTHEGSMGNLCNDGIKAAMGKVLNGFSV